MKNHNISELPAKLRTMKYFSLRRFQIAILLWYVRESQVNVPLWEIILKDKK